MQNNINSETLSIFEVILAKQQNNCPKSIQWVFNACCQTPELAPKVKGKTIQEKIINWISKYNSAFNNRPSVRCSNPPGTTPDPIIDHIISSRLPFWDSDEINKIKYAHRLSMSAENILGLFLEEYLAINLLNHGWHCAWGETIRSVDFCHEDGRLLQVKNRSNSENSSSSRVRLGTEIDKWHRIDARTGSYKWIKLSQTLDVPNGILNEDGFINFIKNILDKNPQALAIESSNPWGIDPNISS